jgi:hypothetical protein
MQLMLNFCTFVLRDFPLMITILGPIFLLLDFLNFTLLLLLAFLNFTS